MGNKAQVLKDYIKFRSLTNKSRAINDISFHVKKFINSTKKPLKDFDEKIIISYLSKIEPKYTQSSLNSIKSSYLKNFIKWCWEDWSSRFRNLDRICSTKKAITKYKAEDMLSEEDFKKLVKEEESFFWKAFFMTLFYGGCRVNEVCKLTKDKVEFTDDGAFITIFSKKNKQQFIKFVPEDTTFYIKKILNKDSNFVFTNPKTKKPITTKGAYWRIRTLSEKVLGRRIDNLTLRHSIATIIYNKDDIKDDDIASQMGHSKSMKATYVKNNLDKLKEKARRIYINPEELPPEKKHELEKRIKELEKQLRTSFKIIQDVNKKMREDIEFEKRATTEIKRLKENLALSSASFSALDEKVKLLMKKSSS